MAPGAPRANGLIASSADILVVDDDPRNLTAIQSVLSDLDLRATMARSGEAALRHLLEQDFAVVLLDVNMPGLDGFETARLIRSRERLRYLPIIFITAFSHDDADLRRGYALGAVDYLFRPIIPEVLRTKIQVFVDLRNITMEVAQQAERLREIERLESIRRLEEERRLWEAESLRMQMEEHRRLNGRLTEMDRRKDEFLAVLAHELRNPLAPIVTSLAVIQSRETSDPLVMRARDAMERQVRHLKRLVDDLLDVSRITNGKLELRLQRLVLRTIVDQAVELCGPTLEAGEQQLVVEHPAEDVVLMGDAARLTQVLANLINNAARYSQKGERIHIRWTQSAGEVSLTVQDHGRGISPEQLPRVFDMFFQAKDGGGGGLGLGLTLVRQLVEMHGGNVTVHSEGPGRGSEFTLRLPLNAEPTDVVARPAPPALPALGRSLRIVVVEDDADVRDGLCDLLRLWGHQVEAASDGPKGVDLLLARQPDVALLDIGLPGLDGYGVARRVRDRLGGATPRLVAMTGFGLPSDRDRAMAAGFDVHLVKPSSPEELLGTLARLSGSDGRSQSAPPRG